ncbi:MAG: hypothetical protein KIT80_20230 [Chitinophagaceae bacterium]|nr:hypothetical protein [Chitinophagaceae bacterium]MCW5929259.1 hypothetical protein [Chitinophagaceae bacterium]
MKSINVSFLRITSLVMLLVIFSFTAFTAQANPEKKEKNEIPVELTYIGSVNQSPVFQLDLVNESGEKVNISIRSSAGDVLYTTSFKGKNFSKKIRFDNIDLSDLQLKLVITSKTKTEVQNFQITQSNRVIEEITVGKL